MSYINVIIYNNEKALEIERYARKKIKHECSVRIKYSVLQDHCLASPAKPCDPRDGIFYPHLTPT